MAGRVYLIGIRWVETTMDTDRIEKTLDPLGNWLRFNGWTWLFWTSLPASAVHQAIQPLLRPNDSVMVVKMDPSDYNGWSPQFVWDWLNDKARRIQRGE